MAKSNAAKSVKSVAGSKAIVAGANETGISDMERLFTDGAFALEFASSKVQTYRNAKPALHAAACAAFYHAAQHGDVRILNAIYGDPEDKEARSGGLFANDRTALRQWVGKLGVTSTVEDHDGQEVEITREWIGFRQKSTEKDGNILKAGFFVRKGMQEARVDRYDPQELMHGDPFFVKENTPTAGMDLTKIINFLAGVKKSLEKKVQDAADNNDTEIHVPMALLAKVNELDTVANEYKNTLAGKTN